MVEKVAAAVVVPAVVTDSGRVCELARANNVAVCVCKKLRQSEEKNWRGGGTRVDRQARVCVCAVAFGRSHTERAIWIEAVLINYAESVENSRVR